MKHFCARFSIVSQVAVLMLLLGICGVAGMSVSSWMAQSIQGNAHAINTSGSLRMQSYRLLSMVPLNANADSKRCLDELNNDLNSPVLLSAVKEEHLNTQFSALQQAWQGDLRPALLAAQHSDDARDNVAKFVGHLDELVSAIDHQTEQRLTMVSMVQKIFIILTLLLLVGTVVYLRRRLLHPWRQLVGMSQAIGQGNFSQRFQQTDHQDEMAILGSTLNAMSSELSLMYGKLEQLVEQKTTDLQKKNQVLSYLYRASRQLHSRAPLCSRLLPVLTELQELTPLHSLQIRLYENNSDEQFDELNCVETQRPKHCPDTHCVQCLNHSEHVPNKPSATVSWSLNDQSGRYGLILAQLPEGVTLQPEQKQLMMTLSEQITSTLALEQQADQQQQLAVMEERSAIARELHDSIAQSLSCLKMKISYLQMQSTALPDNIQTQLQEMREELNAAYRQLRELLTTFRLKLSEPGLLAALQVTVAEFNQRFGFTIHFDYQLPAKSVPSHQAIHLVQIAREALSNILKHAQATQVDMTITLQDDEIVMSICDNGLGISTSPERQNHYGLVIMSDRAQSLNGECRISRRESGGTEVRVTFPQELR
ncbi:nitrate/nitrite two-component system sensor histidine kinase NarX [Hafnia alvei]|uniref:nitrate/nitrite two-component system sensor histidine kinase NarX n=1 Tax=Hafnia alvei TaxID=569 RepID=UPI0005825EFB|nr:nitrate/nitrite two-component system sensor histidine kinase NarX [Hafnia alvei]NEY28419.1 nitrate/nitrite two-component system sensor histidine kinase NarX [Escherichia coli]ANC41124.1 two-component system sensor histidine kinase NarX [Hafnia alvei]KIC99465.1 nitrate/nitrite sensor protein NarX [Hafnia alvei]MBI0276973.1 nitrate/nitrite two-component system sensor histidine kinase NarX [Hafnia alvei]PNL03311.1 nitrate/nitrite two-component system sensor histidine kinase NarX [Hafnia alvei]